MKVLLYAAFLVSFSFAIDTDKDGINDEDDLCPFDRYNDEDGDKMCAVDSCRDDPTFLVPYFDGQKSNGQNCNFFSLKNKGHMKCIDFHKPGHLDACYSCSCSCSHEAACGYDLCPKDAENDVDNDGFCGDIDICPLDKENDADSDRICGNIDTCSLDHENDADSDEICGNVDSCPYDSENDADNDLLCGMKALCEEFNDDDSDNICNDVDSCPIDPENDLDRDKLCAASECFDNPGFTSRSGYTCLKYTKEPSRCAAESLLAENTHGFDVCTSCSCACAHDIGCGFDPCPLDKENDIDSDNLCANEDPCPNDPSNDADSDNICGNVDSCPSDPENDSDGDKLCELTQCVDVKIFESASGYSCSEYSEQKGYCKSDSTDALDVCTSCSCACADEVACGFDPCPHDPENDKDGDQMCADVDVCPLDKENDSDNDSLCADNDPCPNDASNDVDSDSICGQVDSCPMDHENDADGDNMCAEKDQCPLDPDNDADGDMLCAGTLILHA